MKEVPGLFLTKCYSLKINKLKSSHYRDVSMDPMGTCRGSHAIHGVHFGKHRSRKKTLIPHLSPG